jgi:hypothetical protein
VEAARAKALPVGSGAEAEPAVSGGPLAIEAPEVRQLPAGSAADDDIVDAEVIEPTASKAQDRH